VAMHAQIIYHAAIGNLLRSCISVKSQDHLLLTSSVSPSLGESFVISWSAAGPLATSPRDAPAAADESMCDPQETSSGMFSSSLSQLPCESRRPRVTAQ